MRRRAAALGWTARARGRRGSAVLLVLWVLLVLGAVVTAFALKTGTILDEQARFTHGRAALLAAESGVRFALHPRVTVETPGLKSALSPSARFEVELVGEGGRINLGFVIARMLEEPAEKRFLERFLERRGMKREQRDIFIDSMLDWVDADDLRRPNGLEKRAGYRPANRMFRRLEEVAQVHGAEGLVSAPDWQDWFTLWSGGPIDVRWAEAEVLACVPGLGDPEARRWVAWRWGRDGVVGTKDDPEIPGMDEVQRRMGTTGVGFAAAGPWLTLDDPTWRIESTGHFHGTRREVLAVARRGENGAQVLFWQTD